ncbi:unnamed protein product, partial [marine sediment metagenome]
MANFELQTKWFGEDQPNNTNSATADIGSGGDGTVTTTVDDYGTEGNDYTITVVEGIDGGALSAALVGTDITVTLGMSADSVSATNVVEAASAGSDTLTTTALPASTGVSANALSIDLVTAAPPVKATAPDSPVAIAAVSQFPPAAHVNAVT